MTYGSRVWSGIWLDHMIPVKIAAIENALDRATIRLGIYTLIRGSPGPSQK